MQQLSHPSQKRTGASRNGRLAGAKVHVQNGCTLTKTQRGYIVSFLVQIMPDLQELSDSQPLTEISTRCTSWGKGGRCVRLTTYHHTVPLSRNLGALTSWTSLGLHGLLREGFLLWNLLLTKFNVIFGRRKT